MSRPRVLVLGPVRVEGWQREPQRAVVTDLVVFLACHPDRPVSTDRLRAALSGPAADLSEETLRSYASMARRSIGAESLPVSTDRGYALVGVDCDWTRFQDLLDHTAGVDTGRERELLDQAVGLVRGRAFPDRCRWAETEGLPQVIDLTVARTAARLAGLHLATGDPGRAGWAAGVGLGVAPTDEALAAAVLRAGAASGHLASSWERVRSGWADADLDLPAPLTALHAELAHPT